MHNMYLLCITNNYLLLMTNTNRTDNSTFLWLAFLSIHKEMHFLVLNVRGHAVCIIVNIGHKNVEMVRKG